MLLKNTPEVTWVQKLRDIFTREYPVVLIINKNKAVLRADE